MQLPALGCCVKCRPFQRRPDDVQTSAPPAVNGTVHPAAPAPCIGCLDGEHVRMCHGRGGAPLGDWIQTRNGTRYWPGDPVPEDVHLEDIASALAKICRYTGHCASYYSVAQHSVIVSKLVPPELALEGLLHDASEAYLCDVARPVKRMKFMEGYRQVEKVNDRAIRLRFGLQLDESPAVKEADARLLQTEAAQLMAPLHAEWVVSAPPFEGLTISPLSPEDARQLFLARYHELTAPKNGDDPPEICVLCGVLPRSGTWLMCVACGQKASATVAKKGKSP